jgi:GT2 family glycosyltransferase
MATRQDGLRPGVSAVVLSHNRCAALAFVLDRLSTLPLDEVVVVDSGSTDGTAEMMRGRGGAVRYIDAGGNVAVAGRNMGARAASYQYVLMLDDDSYPLPGAVQELRRALDENPGLAVAGGRVRDVDDAGRVVKADGPGDFSWWFRGGRTGPAPAHGWPTFFFPEGAAMVRCSAFLQVGGFFEPYFFASSEVDLTTRLVSEGWDVRYFPHAEFDHMKVSAGRTSGALARRYRVRNQIWYFWLHFPASLSVRRIPAYLAFDLIECLWHGAGREWSRGIVEAWRSRGAVAQYRRPLPRTVIRRAELNRGRMHIQLLAAQALLKSRTKPRRS